MRPRAVGPARPPGGQARYSPLKQSPVARRDRVRPFSLGGPHAPSALYRSRRDAIAGNTSRLTRFLAAERRGLVVELYLRAAGSLL